MSNDDNSDVWVRMYEEQLRHARHHETLRSQSTNIIVAISAAIVAFLGTGVSDNASPTLLGTFLIAINGYGLLMSLKHYERSRLHVEVAGAYRRRVSEVAALSGHTLDATRQCAHSAHKVNFKNSRRLRAYVLWSGLHLVLAAFGIVVWVGDAI